MSWTSRRCWRSCFVNLKMKTAARAAIGLAAFAGLVFLNNTSLFGTPA